MNTGIALSASALTKKTKVNPMKKFLSLIVAVALCGCASSHIKSHSSAPTPQVTPQVTLQVTPEVAAVRGVVLPATPAAKVAAKVAASVPVAKSAAKSVARSYKFAELAGLLIALAGVAFLYGVKIYTWGAKLVKKVLAWIKAHNVIADLKALAAKADADAKAVVSKIEVDFEKDKAAVDPAKPLPVLPPSTTAHLASTESVKATVTEASVLAAIHPKPASKA